MDSEHFTCGQCGTKYAIKDFSRIPDYGKRIKCKCSNILYIFKPDSYYKDNYSETIATYILHKKKAQSAVHLKHDLKRIEGAEKYFAVKKKDFSILSEEDAKKFIADIGKSKDTTQADGFTATLTEFFEILINHQLVSTNPFVGTLEEHKDSIHEVSSHQDEVKPEKKISANVVAQTNKKDETLEVANQENSIEVTDKPEQDSEKEKIEDQSTDEEVSNVKSLDDLPIKQHQHSDQNEDKLQSAETDLSVLLDKLADLTKQVKTLSKKTPFSFSSFLSSSDLPLPISFPYRVIASIKKLNEMFGQKILAALKQLLIPVIFISLFAFLIDRVGFPVIYPYFALCALFVYFDAIKYKVGKIPDQSGYFNLSALTWAIASLFAIGFPVYVVLRGKLIDKAKLHPAYTSKRTASFLLIVFILIVILVFIAAFSKELIKENIIGYHVYDQIEETVFYGIDDTRLVKLLRDSFSDSEWGIVEDDKGRVIIEFTGEISKRLHNRKIQRFATQRTLLEEYPDDRIVHLEVAAIALNDLKNRFSMAEIKELHDSLKSEYGCRLDISDELNTHCSRSEQLFHVVDVLVKKNMSSFWKEGTEFKIQWIIRPDNAFKLYAIKSTVLDDYSGWHNRGEMLRILDLIAAD